MKYYTFILFFILFRLCKNVSCISANLPIYPGFIDTNSIVPNDPDLTKSLPNTQSYDDPELEKLLNTLLMADTTKKASRIFDTATIGMKNGVKLTINLDEYIYAQKIVYPTNKNVDMPSLANIDSVQSTITISCDQSVIDSVNTSLALFPTDVAGWYMRSKWFVTFTNYSSYMPIAFIAQKYKRTWVVCDVKTKPNLMAQFELRHPLLRDYHITRIHNIFGLQSNNLLLSKGNGVVLSQNAGAQYAYVYYYHSPQYRNKMYYATRVDMVTELPLMCDGEESRYFSIYLKLNSQIDPKTLLMMVYKATSDQSASYYLKAEIKINNYFINVYCYDYYFNQIWQPMIN